MGLLTRNSIGSVHKPLRGSSPNMKKCSNCKKRCEKFDNSKSAIRTYLLSNDSAVHDLIIFYEYLSPNTSSDLSFPIDLETSTRLLEEMLKIGFRKDKTFSFVSGKITDDDLGKFSLNGTDINSSCKRFVCRVCSSDRKNALTALLRHVRNSIAHARYSIIRGGNYYKFLFEDRDGEKDITFKMVINHSTLKKWKEILMSSESHSN